MMIDDRKHVGQHHAARALADKLTAAEDLLPQLSDIRSTHGRPSPARRTVPRWRDRGLLSVAVAGIVVVTVCSVALAGWGFSSLSSSTAGPASSSGADPVLELPRESLSTTVSATGSSLPAVEAVVDGQCRDLRDGPVSVSSGRGGVIGGVAVIERFTFGVYVLRSASAARSVVDPKGAVSATSQLQEWINHRPQGSRHCVKVTDLGGRSVGCRDYGDTT